MRKLPPLSASTAIIFQRQFTLHSHKAGKRNISAKRPGDLEQSSVDHFLTIQQLTSIFLCKGHPQSLTLPVPSAFLGAAVWASTCLCRWDCFSHRWLFVFFICAIECKQLTCFLLVCLQRYISWRMFLTNSQNWGSSQNISLALLLLLWEFKVLRANNNNSSYYCPSLTQSFSSFIISMFGINTDDYICCVI